MAFKTSSLAFLLSEQHTEAFLNIAAATKPCTVVITAKTKDKIILKGKAVACKLESLVAQIKAINAESRKDGTRHRNPKYEAKSASNSASRKVNCTIRSIVQRQGSDPRLIAVTPATQSRHGPRYSLDYLVSERRCSHLRTRQIVVRTAASTTSSALSLGWALTFRACVGCSAGQAILHAVLAYPADYFAGCTNKYVPAWWQRLLMFSLLYNHD